MAHLLGIDLGSSSVKVTLVDAGSGKALASAQSPVDREMAIDAPQEGWAEQDPEAWWLHTCSALDALAAKQPLDGVIAIGIAYQMHGLVLLDEAGAVLAAEYHLVRLAGGRHGPCGGEKTRPQRPG